jgi:hypothetical protein
MTLKQTGAMVPALILLGLSAAGQNQETFKGRLSLIPIDATMRAEITGTGSASAVLAGMKLSINGNFVGLHTPATAARLGQGPVTGVTGATIADLTVSKATSGTVSGSVDLTTEQVANLRKGKFYIQIYSEKAPNGNLRAWLLK